MRIKRFVWRLKSEPNTALLMATVAQWVQKTQISETYDKYGSSSFTHQRMFELKPQRLEIKGTTGS